MHPSKPLGKVGSSIDCCGAALVLVLMLHGGCAEKQAEVDSGAAVDGAAADVGAKTSVTVGPTGGKVSSADQKLELEFPAGALGEDTAITVRAATSAPAGHLGQAYELGPDGATFLKPVTLRITYDAAKLVRGSRRVLWLSSRRVPLLEQTRDESPRRQKPEQLPDREGATPS